MIKNKNYFIKLNKNLNKIIINNLINNIYQKMKYKYNP